MKTCSKCKQVKELDKFDRSRNRSDGRYSQCKECKHASKAIYRQLNLEKAQEFSRQWRLDNSYAIKQYRRDYAKLKPEIGRTRRMRYKARKLNQLGYMPVGWFDAMIRVYGYYCGDCHSMNAIQVDHVIALANGGLDEISNLQFLCASHNAGKRDYHNTDYRSVRLLDTVTT